jgi:hypothetical protein
MADSPGFGSKIGQKREKDACLGSFWGEKSLFFSDLGLIRACDPRKTRLSSRITVDDTLTRHGTVKFR